MNTYDTKALPKWLQHQMGAIPDPTPEEIEADRLESEKALEYFNKHGKWDAKSAAGLDALNAYYSSMGQPVGNWLARLDYARLFRIVSRLLALAGFALLSYTLYRYVQVDGVGALGSAGHYAMGAFFTLMTFATGKQYDGWNFLFLLGLLGIIATF